MINDSDTYTEYIDFDDIMIFASTGLLLSVLFYTIRIQNQYRWLNVVKYYQEKKPKVNEDIFSKYGYYKDEDF